MPPSRDEFLRQFMAKYPDIEIAETLHLTCPKHGPYTNTRLVQTFQDGSRQDLKTSGCPSCNAEVEQEEIIQSRDREEHYGMFKAAQIPAKYESCMLRNFRIDDENIEHARLKADARQKCLDFIEDRIRSIVLTGPTGRGKSHLGASMLKGCIQTGREGLYVVERKIHRDIHESYLDRKDLPTEGQVIARYSRIPVLFIDEIGRSSWTDHEAQTLYEIIDNRDSSRLKTIMAGNLTPAEFEEKFDDSFRRKLGACELVCRWGAWESRTDEAEDHQSVQRLA